MRQLQAPPAQFADSSMAMVTPPWWSRPDVAVRNTCQRQGTCEAASWGWRSLAEADDWNTMSINVMRSTQVAAKHLRKPPNECHNSTWAGSGIRPRHHRVDTARLMTHWVSHSEIQPQWCAAAGVQGTWTLCGQGQTPGLWVGDELQVVGHPRRWLCEIPVHKSKYSDRLAAAW